MSALERPDAEAMFLAGMIWGHLLPCPGLEAEMRVASDAGLRRAQGVIRELGEGHAGARAPDGVDYVARSLAALRRETRRRSQAN